VTLVAAIDDYGASVERGAWGDGSRYLQAVEDDHASYASIHWWPRELLAANRVAVTLKDERGGIAAVLDGQRRVRLGQVRVLPPGARR
jgi:hypothetical protein